MMRLINLVWLMLVLAIGNNNKYLQISNKWNFNLYILRLSNDKMYVLFIFLFFVFAASYEMISMMNYIYYRLDKQDKGYRTG